MPGSWTIVLPLTTRFDFRFHTTVDRPAFFGRVIGYRTRFAITNRFDTAAVQAVLIDQHIAHRIGTTLGKTLVVGIGADGVGMTFDDRRGLPVLLHEVGQVADIVVATRLHFCAVEIELHIQLDTHRFGNRLGLDLGRNRLDGFHHRDGLLFGTAGPPIGSCRTTADQCTPTGVSAAFYRAQCSATHTPDGGTGGPVLFLHPCTTGQESGHDDDGYCCP